MRPHNQVLGALELRDRIRVLPQRLVDRVLLRADLVPVDFYAGSLVSNLHPDVPHVVSDALATKCSGVPTAAFIVGLVVVQDVVALSGRLKDDMACGNEVDLGGVVAVDKEESAAAFNSGASLS